MSTRLIPAYVERPAWKAYDAYMQFLGSDDLDDLRDAIEDLGAALIRGDALTYAPDYVLAQIGTAAR